MASTRRLVWLPLAAALLVLPCHARGHGVPTAVIIVPRQSCPVVDTAASELQGYIAKATGQAVAIVGEGTSSVRARMRLYLGDTHAARAAGIDTSRMPRDGYRVRVHGGDAFLAGRDGPGYAFGDGLRTSVGTLFAVYDVLENDLGVRWLWPGVSGEYVPRRRSLSIRVRDVTTKPRFRFCGMRSERLDEVQWMRRMRMHEADNLSYGHAFGAWAGKCAAEHPDWFEMDAAGVRQPGKSMCVSNPGFQRRIVETWWADQQKHPGVLTNINICENDGPGACCCPNCRAWDGAEAPKPRPEPYREVHNVSRRYARFANEVLKLARAHDPRAEATFYAYSNLVFEPDGVRLDRSAIVGFVPDVFFPRTPVAQEWTLKQGLGWIKSGASLFLRPNYMLHGYCMPVNWSHQYAEEFQVLERKGLVGTDYDSLTGMWSTMGLSLYVLGRLHVRPRMPVDAVISEYCKAFGPAAPQIRAYWDYWERYSLAHLDQFADGVWQYYWYPEHVARRFPLECFEPARRLLDEAARVATRDTDACAKVAFLRQGLEHARLCVKTSMGIDEAGKDPAKRAAATSELAAFRKGLKDPMVVNLDDGDSSCRSHERKLGWPE